jgi:DNA-binding transcriptional regulator YiaG
MGWFDMKGIFNLTQNRTTPDFNSHQIDFEGLGISSYEYQQPRQRQLTKKTVLARTVCALAFSIATSQTPIRHQKPPNENDYSVTASTYIQPSLTPAIAQEQGVNMRLQQIRENLGVSLSVLAELLQISRSTLYNWMGENSNLQEANKTQLERLEKRSRLWKSISEYPPGVFMRSREIEGKTLASWLQDADVSDQQLGVYMQVVAQKALARERRLARASIPSIPLASRNLDRITHRNDD